MRRTSDSEHGQKDDSNDVAKLSTVGGLVQLVLLCQPSLHLLSDRITRRSRQQRRQRRCRLI